MIEAVIDDSNGDVGGIPALLDDHTITVRECSIKRNRLIPDGKSQELSLINAIKLLAPSHTSVGRSNVTKLKVGFFIGVKSGDLSNFVIVNPTSDGDIRWLIKKQPDLVAKIRNVYIVESVFLRRNVIDLPSDGEGNGDRS